MLVQLNGGLTANDPTGRLDRRADGLAGEFNRTLGRAVARVERPWGRRFPLHGQVGYGLFAGRVRGRQAVFRGGRFPYLLQFDADGGQTHEDPLDLGDRLRRPVEELDEREVLAALRRECGFEPGLVFVREFESEEAGLTIHLWGSYEDVVDDPDGRSDEDEHEKACTSLDGYWMKGGNFPVLLDTDYWAGSDGVIHSS